MNYENIIKAVTGFRYAKTIDQSTLARKIISEYRKLIPELLKAREDVESVIYMLDNVAERNKDYPRVNFAFLPNRGSIYIGGSYEPVSDLIYINIDPSMFKEDDELETELNLLVYFKMMEDTLKHELIHRQQYMKMKKKDEPGYDEILSKHVNRQDAKNRREYLADIREIMTHASDAYSELRRSGYTKQQIRDDLGKVDIARRSDTMKEYLKTFGANDPVYKKLVKYMYEYAMRK